MSGLPDVVRTLERWKRRLRGKDRISVKADEVKAVLELILEMANELVTVQDEDAA